jgi:hypothetical protein
VKSHNHYEAAFEDFLRKRQIPYVAVDESKRAVLRESRLKSFDFIVYSESDSNWLVDIKGRRWAARPDGTRPTWQNWVTQADLDGLRQWEEVFGDGFRALLVFAYWTDRVAPPAEIAHRFHGLHYVFAAVPLTDYSTHARVRSPKWGTVNVPVRTFRQHVRPVAQWL